MTAPACPCPQQPNCQCQVLAVPLSNYQPKWFRLAPMSNYDYAAAVLPTAAKSSCDASALSTWYDKTVVALKFRILSTCVIEYGFKRDLRLIFNIMTLKCAVVTDHLFTTRYLCWCNSWVLCLLTIVTCNCVSKRWSTEQICKVTHFRATLIHAINSSIGENKHYGAQISDQQQ